MNNSFLIWYLREMSNGVYFYNFGFGSCFIPRTLFCFWNQTTIFSECICVLRIKLQQKILKVERYNVKLRPQISMQKESFKIFKCKREIFKNILHWFNIYLLFFMNTYVEFSERGKFLETANSVRMLFLCKAKSYLFIMRTIFTLFLI